MTIHEPEDSLNSLPIFDTPTPALTWERPSTPPPPAPTSLSFPKRSDVAHVTASKPSTSRPASVDSDADFWSEVEVLKLAVSATMANDRSFLEAPEEERIARGHEYITTHVREHISHLMSTGQPKWHPDFEAKVKAALFSKLFGLGRLQPLVDDDTVENIEIYGYDNVTLLRADGSREKVAPIATSDQELIDDIAYLAAQRSRQERAFTPANPRLSLTLPGGHRLQAVAWCSPRPRVTIRRHRLVDVDLHELEERAEIDHTLSEFLSAAVRAHKSIVVSGRGQGSGKTTLVRALANAMDPDETLATIETEFELFLHEYPERHKIVTPLEARPGSGERGADGRPAGEITVSDLIYDSLRFNASRVIVGEVRGKEVLGMFKAMQMGNGSFSTIHADSAVDVIERLVTCAVEEKGTSEDFAYRLVGQHIDLIVFIDNTILPSGRKYRYVSEVIEVALGEGDRKIATTRVFSPGPDGRAVPNLAPSFIEELEAEGFTRDAFISKRATWPQMEVSS